MIDKLESVFEAYMEGIQRVCDRVPVINVFLSGVLLFLFILTLIVSFPIHLPIALVGLFLEDKNENVD